MEKLILVRYAQYDQLGHITDQGRHVMEETAIHIAPYVSRAVVSVLAANTSRAVESAMVLSGALSINAPVPVDELYAAEEDGRLPDCAIALSAIVREVGEADTVIAVVSREYIETLPAHIAQNNFMSQEFSSITLERGEALIIDFHTKQIFRTDFQK
jgi:hypothetical protein